jgi:hypothetical protein
MPKSRTLTSICPSVRRTPEQTRSARLADGQSDIWALGVILYELITGSVPFSGETLADVMMNIMTLPAPPLRSVRPEIPPALDAAILKCLEKDKARRPTDVAEVALSLAPFAPKRSLATVERVLGIVRSAGLSSRALSLPSAAPCIAPSAGTSAAPVSSPTSDDRRAESGQRPIATIVAAGIAITFMTVLLGGGVGALVVRSATRPALPPVAPVAPVANGALGTTGVLGADAGTAEAGTTLAEATDAGGIGTSDDAEGGSRGSSNALSDAGTTAPAAVSARHRRPGRAPAPLSSSSSAPPAVDPSKGAECDPPYVLDNQGKKHFRPECYLLK